jgi:hypothetical protein
MSDDHDHAQAAGLRRAVAEIYRPHRHDIADALDTVLEGSERGVRAVTISFAVLVVTAGPDIPCRPGRRGSARWRQPRR